MHKHIPAVPSHRPRSAHRQRGVSLLFALLALVALLLTTLALVRSVDTGTMTLGNIGFKQDATAAADQATREAIAWLTTANADSAVPLNNDNPTSGYFASSFEYSPSDPVGAPSSLGPLDVTGRGFPTNAARQLIDWDKDSCASASPGSFASCIIQPFSVADKINGNTATYVILRLCNKAGDPSKDNTVTCSTSLNGLHSNSPARGGCDYSDPLCGRYSNAPPGSGGINYRILVRVQGARNTISFTETIVHF
ncbi:MAG: pilus assembly protein PilX [Betaproteobacteria bacterium]|nr:pilus assembly protein PilX [Betaproteobacteria bacterium]